MERVNIAELLKGCPSGMELYCTLYYNVFFDKICEDDLYPIKCYTIENGIKDSVDFTEFGEFHIMIKSKCVIFPKGKTTWDGFHKPFEPGDIVINDNNEYAFIYSGENDQFWECYCGVYCGTRDICINDKQWSDKRQELRLATEEEKEKLFQVIRDNGYYWNSETKKLEKIFPYNIGTKVWIKSDKEHKYIHTIVGISRNACGNLEYEVKEEKTGIVVHYPKELLIPITKEPQFKIGDIIQDKDGYKVKITEVNIEDECYGYESMIVKGIGGIAFKEQDDWKLVPNKFDITTLKPFDKVLVRDNSSGRWDITFYELYDNTNSCYPHRTLGGNIYKYCIPYEGNEHLLGKTDDCNDFYKIW